MSITGALGRLFVAQGITGVLLAVLANSNDRPAVAWILTFLGFVLISTGAVLWMLGNEEDDDELKAAEAGPATCH